MTLVIGGRAVSAASGTDACAGVGAGSGAGAGDMGGGMGAGAGDMGAGAGERKSVGAGKGVDVGGGCIRTNIQARSF